MGSQKKMFVGILLASSFVLAVNLISAADKPNIVVIWGDDIGQSKVSPYSMGLMGYQTPDIDRVAKEGMKLTASWNGEKLSLVPIGVHNSQLNFSFPNNSKKTAGTTPL